MQTIRDVEVFQEGDHKEGPWDASSLMAMARNAAILKDLLTPTFGIGHGDEATAFGDEGEPAFGIAPDYRVEYRTPQGETQPRATLLADLYEVPDSLAALIHAGAYRTISPEIYTTLPKSLADKGVDGPVIKRICVLGGAIPEVKTLKDVTEIYRRQVPAAAFSDARPVMRLTLTRTAVDADRGVAVAFSDVTPLSKDNSMTGDQKKPAAKRLTPKALTAVKRFSDMAAGGPVPRDELIAILADMGVDTSTVTDAVPDAFLAECARVQRSMLEEMSAANAAEGNADAEANGAKQAAEEQPAEMGDGKPAEQAVEKPAEKPADKPADAKPEDDKNKKPDAAAMSDKPAAFPSQADIDAKIAAAVDAGLARFSEARKSLAKELDEANRTSIALFCEQQRVAGKLLPAEIDGGLPELMAKVAELGGGTVKFSDGTETDLLTRMKQVIAARPQVARFADVLVTKPLTDEDEKAKVVRFAEDRKESFAKIGKTPAQVAEQFATIRKANPSLTADKFCANYTTGVTG
mgnify:CR=1 FL=1